MPHRVLGLMFGWVCAALVGCGPSPTPSKPHTEAIRPEQLVGKWHLVRVAGEHPSSLNIKTLRIDIARDGTWTSEVQMLGRFAGMIIQSSGKWSLTDKIVSYTAGQNSGQSRPRFKSDRLILDPDFNVRKDGTAEVPGEYERDF